MLLAWLELCCDKVNIFHLFLSFIKMIKMAAVDKLRTVLVDCVTMETSWAEVHLVASL